MGMSKHLQAFIPDTDETYKKHKKVLEACLEAGIERLPIETATYFGSEYPENYLLEEKLTVDMKEGVHYQEWGDDSSQGFEIELKDIPIGVTKLRFYNSW